jgi:translation elongation factor EF-4
MEVFSQRLHDEFGMEVITTTPSVPYYFEVTNTATKEVTKIEISNIAKWPKVEAQGRKIKIFEPMVRTILITPTEYYGALTELVKERRGIDIEITHIDDGQIMIGSTVPWQEVVCDMHDQIKNLSSGYASFNYEESGYAPSELVKVEIAINGETCEPLSFVSHASKVSLYIYRIIILLQVSRNICHLYLYIIIYLSIFLYTINLNQGSGGGSYYGSQAKRSTGPTAIRDSDPGKDRFYYFSKGEVAGLSEGCVVSVR